MNEMLSRLLLLSEPRTVHARLVRTDRPMIEGLGRPFIHSPRRWLDQKTIQFANRCIMDRLTYQESRAIDRRQDAMMRRPTSSLHGTGAGADGQWAKPEATDDRSTTRGGHRIADAVAVASGRQPTMKTRRRRNATGKRSVTTESSKFVPHTKRSLYTCTNYRRRPRPQRQHEQGDSKKMS
jgi:hypothetical protein